MAQTACGGEPMKIVAIILIILFFVVLPYALLKVASMADDHMETLNDFKEEK